MDIWTLEISREREREREKDQEGEKEGGGEGEWLLKRENVNPAVMSNMREDLVTPRKIIHIREI